MPPRHQTTSRRSRRRRNPLPRRPASSPGPAAGGVGRTLLPRSGSSRVQSAAIFTDPGPILRHGRAGSARPSTFYEDPHPCPALPPRPSAFRSIVPWVSSSIHSRASALRFVRRRTKQSSEQYLYTRYADPTWWPSRRNPAEFKESALTLLTASGWRRRDGIRGYLDRSRACPAPPLHSAREKTTSTIALRATISTWGYIGGPPEMGTEGFTRQAQYRVKMNIAYGVIRFRVRSNARWTVSPPFVSRLTLKWDSVLSMHAIQVELAHLGKSPEVKSASTKEMRASRLACRSGFFRRHVAREGHRGPRLRDRPDPVLLRRTRPAQDLPRSWTLRGWSPGPQATRRYVRGSKGRGSELSRSPSPICAWACTPARLRLTSSASGATTVM